MTTFLLDVFLGLEHAPEHLEDVFTLPGHGLEIAKNISCEEPDLAAVKASRPDQSDCFLGPNVIELCRLADITFLGLHGGEGENGNFRLLLTCSVSATQVPILSAAPSLWIKD